MPRPPCDLARARPARPWTLLPALLTLVASATPAAAETLRVPQDQPTLQAALDAAGNDDVVLLSAGSYPGEFVLTGKARVTLRAKGKVLLVPPEPAVELPTLLEATACPGLVLEGLRFVANGKGTGLVLDGCTGVSVTRCEFSALTTGLWAEDTAGLLLTRSRVEDTLRGVDLLRVRRSLVQRTRLDDCTSLGLRARQCEELTVEHNAVSGSDIGLQTDQACVGVLVLDNTLKDCGDGLSVAGRHCQVDDNTVTGCERGLCLPGFLADASVSASGNRISQCSGDGVSSACESLVLRGNRVRQCGGSGIQILSGSALAEGNRVSACAGDGIRTNEALVTLAGNRVRNSGGFDIFAVYPSSTVLLGNSYKTFGSTF